VNLVPWFPELAVATGLLALVPALWTLRRLPARPSAVLFGPPVALVLAATIALDLLISARTGGALALGGAAALLGAALASAGLASPVAALGSWGAALLGLGALFEVFGGAAGMDDGGWKLLGQLAATFALGSALVAGEADAGVFAAAGAVVVAAATPLVANRVDGVALPVLIAVIAAVPAAAGVLARMPPRPRLIAGAVAAALLAGGVAAGLDPVALDRHGDTLPASLPFVGSLLGIALAVVVTTVRDRRWAAAAVVVSVFAVHLIGPYALAVGGIAVIAGAGTSARTAVAATTLAAVALLAASHSGGPLVIPHHLRGWIVTAGAAAVVAGLGIFGKGGRLALVRVVLLEWIILAPLMSS